MARGGVFHFEGFRLDRQSRVLFRRDEAGAFVPIVVGSRALDVLDVLLDRAGNLVLRDELMAAVWPATTVAGRRQLHPDHPRARLPVRRPGDAGRGRYLGTPAERRATAA